MEWNDFCLQWSKTKDNNINCSHLHLHLRISPFTSYYHISVVMFSMWIVGNVFSVMRPVTGSTGAVFILCSRLFSLYHSYWQCSAISFVNSIILSSFYYSYTLQFFWRMFVSWFDWFQNSYTVLFFQKHNKSYYPDYYNHWNEHNLFWTYTASFYSYQFVFWKKRKKT